MSKYAQLKQECDHETVLLKNYNTSFERPQHYYCCSTHNPLHILNFPPPPKRGKECSTTYCNVYGSALLLMQAFAVMCTAVRWCRCRLFLLSRRYPHGEHHARDIANTPGHISSLELALIRYTQVTCHIGTKQTQSTP